MFYIVICLNDEGAYTLATRTMWKMRDDAARYAAAIAECRMALVVECPRGLNFRSAL